MATNKKQRKARVAQKKRSSTKTSSGKSKTVAKSLEKAKKPSVTKKSSKKTSRQYDVVRKSIANYCLQKYNRRCSRKDVTEIYRILKRRVEEIKDPKNPKKELTLMDIQSNIDQYLGYRNAKTVPDEASTPFEWYELVNVLYTLDGGYFKDDDLLVFDLSVISAGKITCSYAELPFVYKADIYTAVIEYIEQVEATIKRDYSPPPSFVYSEKDSDVKSRKYVWKFSLLDSQSAEEELTLAQMKEQQELQKQAVKPKRGRPKKQQIVSEQPQQPVEPQQEPAKRRRGRPKKVKTEIVPPSKAKQTVKKSNSRKTERLDSKKSNVDKQLQLIEAKKSLANKEIKLQALIALNAKNITKAEYNEMIKGL